MNRLILASGSPRRKELLQQMNLSFDIITSNVTEDFPENEKPENIVMYLANKKAEAIFEKEDEAVIIGADTIVISNGNLLGKPSSPDEVRYMLSSLSGKSHQVYTGVSIISKEKTCQFFESTHVTFWELTKEDIDAYIDSDEPFDKAGGYGIQGYGAMLVKKIDGDYYNVVGLPISRTIRELKRFGIES